ncbi:MAG: hypothetical protein N2C14_13120 [Planctomycetales bacterium]
MRLVEIQWNPTRRQLRQFGMICLVALPAAGWFWGGGLLVVGMLACAGFVAAVAGFLAPSLLKPVFVTLMLLAAPLGMVIAELAMLLIYFGVFLPIGLVFRLARRDGLDRTMDKKATTYWRSKKQPGGPASYYRQS